MSRPCCTPHHRRAAARPTKFPAVAPVVITPLHAPGSPNSSFSHATLTCSRCAAKGELTQLYATWSRAEARSASRSAITGRSDWIAASEPSRLAATSYRSVWE